MDLANILYNYDNEIVDSDKSISLKSEIITSITENSMTPLYESLCIKYRWQIDEELTIAMKYVH